jgi:hypothetical protein
MAAFAEGDYHELNPQIDARVQLYPHFRTLAPRRDRNSCDPARQQKAGLSLGLFISDGWSSAGMTRREQVPHNTRLLSFTFSASR